MNRNHLLLEFTHANDAFVRKMKALKSHNVIYQTNICGILQWKTGVSIVQYLTRARRTSQNEACWQLFHQRILH